MPVLRPADGDVLLHNTECVVAWRYADPPPPNVAPTVDIELQCATTGRPLRTIATDVCNQGSYFWTIGATVPVGGPYRLFIGNLLENGSFHDEDDPHGSCMDTRDDADDAVGGARDVERMYSGVFRVRDTNEQKKHSCAETRSMVPRRRFFSSVASPPVPRVPSPGNGTPTMPSVAAVVRRDPQQQQQRTSPVPAAVVAATAAATAAAAATDEHRTTLCAHIYARVAMDTGTVRRALQRIRQEPPVTVDTNVKEDHAEPMRAGAFAVRYLLFRYYKKQLMQCNAALERSILHWINTNQRRGALKHSAA